MGKGYNNFMSKKAFHPGSYANQKRIHEAEAKAEAKRKHDEETLLQYQKEQELFNQKSLVSKQSKEKLSLSFMYEPPPGVEKPDEKRSDKAVEWKASNGNVLSESIKTKPSPSSSKEQQPNICLEWKREKPVSKKTTSHDTVKQELVQKTKTEKSTDPHNVDPCLKRENLVKTETPLNHVKREIKPENDGLRDQKRIKKER